MDLKSAVPNGTWGFDSPSRYNSKALLEIKGQNRSKINYDKMINIFGDRSENINKFKDDCPQHILWLFYPIRYSHEVNVDAAPMGYLPSSTTKAYLWVCQSIALVARNSSF